MTLSSFLDRVVRPAALGCLVLIAVAATLAVGDSAANLQQYPAVFWGSWSLASGLLAVTAALPARLARRFRVVGLGGSGILVAALAGNGFTDGPARALLASAVLLAGAIAVAATVAQFDSARNRPATRL